MVGITRSTLTYRIVTALVLMLVLGGLTGCGKKEPAPAPTDSNDTSPLEGLTPAQPTPAETANVPYEPSLALQNVVKAAKTWVASFQPWWGKIVPADFTLTDIEGNVHSLSDYRGRNVLVVIWRTWNSTCTLQVPQLNELRSTFDDKALAILAISDESAGVLKEFAGQQSINYTVLTGTNLPAPFGDVQYAPGNFFIGPQGKLKLAATGLIPAADAAAIIKAP
ncbi:MAG: TlpA family protein disulfide reductase [Sedimentisphaerales bacterium]|nr:TlpA family protein disulfide reductase [Sedimentisphaerales bacterium]